MMRWTVALNKGTSIGSAVGVGTALGRLMAALQAGVGRLSSAVRN